MFGDGTAIIKTAPGHTPGHQMLFLKLAKFGPLLLAGDLYHLPEERTLDRVPTFDFNADMTRATRKQVEDFSTPAMPPCGSSTTRRSTRRSRRRPNITSSVRQQRQSVAAGAVARILCERAAQSTSRPVCARSQD